MLPGGGGWSAVYDVSVRPFRAQGWMGRVGLGVGGNVLMCMRLFSRDIFSIYKVLGLLERRPSFQPEAVSRWLASLTFSRILCTG